MLCEKLPGRYKVDVFAVMASLDIARKSTGQMPIIVIETSLCSMIRPIKSCEGQLSDQ